jgi:hypothetical protein
MIRILKENQKSKSEVLTFSSIGWTTVLVVQYNPKEGKIHRTLDPNQYKPQTV